MFPSPGVSAQNTFDVVIRQLERDSDYQIRDYEAYHSQEDVDIDAAFNINIIDLGNKDDAVFINWH